ncbi:MAG: 50S ribosomal protein L21 [candidate division WOR-3 bacterium]
MFAIAEIKGFEYFIKEGEKLIVPRIQAEVGEVIKLDDVLFLKANDKVWIGTPKVKGAFIEAKVLSHFKGEKIIVFKFRRRENYRRKKGFRPSLTEIEILKINPPEEIVSNGR